MLSFYILFCCLLFFKIVCFTIIFTDRSKAVLLYWLYMLIVLMSVIFFVPR